MFDIGFFYCTWDLWLDVSPAVCQDTASHAGNTAHYRGAITTQCKHACMRYCKRLHGEREDSVATGAALHLEVKYVA